MAGKLYLCATPIGNLGDITLRCLETLKMVDLIACEDTRHTLKLLNHFGISKPLTSYFEHNRKEKGEYIISLIREGQNVALVSDAGTVAISDPGEDLVALCAKHGVDVVPIPGAVAGINALICSGLSTGRFCFEGFLSMNKQSRREHLASVADEARTMIFYEAPHKLLSTLKDMLAFFGDRKICLCREMTKIHEEFLRTTLSGAVAHFSQNAPKGEFVLVIEGQRKENAAPFWEGKDVCWHVEHYLAQGVDEKQALKSVAKDRGVAKNEIYRAYKL